MDKVRVVGMSNNVNVIGIELNQIRSAAIEDSWLGYSSDTSGRLAVQANDVDNLTMNRVKGDMGIHDIELNGTTRKFAQNDCWTLETNGPFDVTNNAGATVYTNSYENRGLTADEIAPMVRGWVNLIK
jgi:hypothetical protein